jgi:hypothetical protein
LASERLIGTYRQVLERLDPGSETSAAGREAVARAMEAVTSCAGNAGQVLGEMLSALVAQTHSVQAVRAAVEQAGGFAAKLADIEEVAPSTVTRTSCWCRSKSRAGRA